MTRSAKRSKQVLSQKRHYTTCIQCFNLYTLKWLYTFDSNLFFLNAIEQKRKVDLDISEISSDLMLVEQIRSFGIFRVIQYLSHDVAEVCTSSIFLRPYGLDWGRHSAVSRARARFPAECAFVGSEAQGRRWPKDLIVCVCLCASGQGLTKITYTTSIIT